jgi:protein-S-isoprenylcysteine O-methyltransferase Ste14
MGAFGVISLLIFFFSSSTDRIRFWTFDGDTVRWLGVVVCFLDGLLRLIPVYVLGKRFTGLVAIQPKHKLETKGIYGTIRNPSYLGLLISSLRCVDVPFGRGSVARGIDAGAVHSAHAS